MKYLVLSLFLVACGPVEVSFRPPIYVVETHPYPVPMGSAGQYCRTQVGIPLCNPGLVCAHLATSPYYTWTQWRCIALGQQPGYLFDAYHESGVLVEVGIYAN